MPRIVISPEDRAFLREDAANAARVLQTEDDETMTELVLKEMAEISSISLGVGMVAAARGWTPEQYYKGVLYALLRRERAWKEVSKHYEGEVDRGRDPMDDGKSPS